MLEFVNLRSAVVEEKRRSSKARDRSVRIGTVAVFLLCLLVVPALFRPSASGKLPFDRRCLAEIEAIRPDYVFIGNSMLETRIDLSVMAGRFGRHSCYLMWSPGAESAWLHQVLKNVVLAAHHRPKTVFIFFRDAYLTLPTHRTSDRYWWQIERLSHEDEPELALTMQMSRTWREKLQAGVGSLYPVQKYRERANHMLRWMASWMIAPGTVDYGQSTAGRYNPLFDLDKLRNIEVADDANIGRDDLKIYDFDRQLSTSFLPSMLRMAKSSGVRLFFIRVQRRPTADGPPPQTEELRQYMGKLQRYLIENGALYHDFTGDPEMTLECYLDGDHIKPEWKAASTELFLKRLRSYFP